MALPAAVPVQRAGLVDDGGAVSRWADLDGPVHYADFGGPRHAPLAICVHGLGGSHLNWLALAPALTPSCRVLAVDLAGHGLTEAAGRSTTVEANARLLARFLRQVVDTPAILVGNSMGGMIAVLAAAADPGAVSGLVLIDPALPARPGAHPGLLPSLGIVGYALPGVGRLLVTASRRWAGPSRSVESILKVSCVDPSRVPADVVARLVALAQQRLSYPGTESDFIDAFHSTLRMLIAPARYEAAMRALRQPVLLVHGEKDSLVSAKAASRAADRRWTFEVMPDVGHVPQLEAPEQTAAIVLRWLSGAGSIAAARATHDF
jgi:pimeloyl-ACP methyl ester carboxylesterase